MKGRERGVGGNTFLARPHVLRSASRGLRGRSRNRYGRNQTGSALVALQEIFDGRSVRVTSKCAEDVVVV